MKKMVKCKKERSWWHEGFISNYFLYIFYIIVNLVIFQAMILSKQLLILQNIKTYSNVEKYQLQVFNFINNNLNKLENGNYQFQDINIDVTLSENQLLVKAYEPINMIYIFSIQDDNIIDYQRYKG